MRRGRPIEQFYPANAEVYRDLGQLCTEHEEFREFYEQRVFLWPLADELRQLETFMEQVVPLGRS